MRDECGVYEQYGSAGEHQPQSSDEMERGRDGAGGRTGGRSVSWSVRDTASPPSGEVQGIGLISFGRAHWPGTTDRVLSFDFRFRAETQLFLATCAQRAEKKNGLKV